jgi:ribosomal protein S18 acetylase RimI-like enzyme
MQIRRAVEADLRALSELDRRAWTLETNPILPDGKTWFEGEVALENVLVACENEAVVGYVHLDDALPPHLFSAAHSGRVRGLVVAPERRGTGLGRALLQAVEERARRHGYRKLVLQVLGTNTRAQRVYERAGFVREGCITGLFQLNGQYVDDLWYAKWL